MVETTKKPKKPVIAWDRDEDAPCERGTEGCCIKHSSSSTPSSTSCEAW